jgi:hypothetical protein
MDYQLWNKASAKKAESRRSIDEEKIMTAFIFFEKNLHVTFKKKIKTTKRE